MHLRPLWLQSETDAAIVGVDQVAKSRTRARPWAIGGQLELAALDGAVYAVDVIRPFARKLCNLGPCWRTGRIGGAEWLSQGFGSRVVRRQP